MFRVRVCCVCCARVLCASAWVRGCVRAYACVCVRVRACARVCACVRVSGCEQHRPSPSSPPVAPCRVPSLTPFFRLSLPGLSARLWADSALALLLPGLHQPRLNRHLTTASHASDLMETATIMQPGGNSPATPCDPARWVDLSPTLTKCPTPVLVARIALSPTTPTDLTSSPPTCPTCSRCSAARPHRASPWSSSPTAGVRLRLGHLLRASVPIQRDRA